MFPEIILAIILVPAVVIGSMEAFIIAAMTSRGFDKVALPAMGAAFLSIISVAIIYPTMAQAESFADAHGVVARVIPAALVCWLAAIAIKIPFVKFALGPRRGEAEPPRRGWRWAAASAAVAQVATFGSVAILVAANTDGESMSRKTTLNPEVLARVPARYELEAQDRAHNAIVRVRFTGERISSVYRDYSYDFDEGARGPADRIPPADVPRWSVTMDKKGSSVDIHDERTGKSRILKLQWMSSPTLVEDRFLVFDTAIAVAVLDLETMEIAGIDGLQRPKVVMAGE